MRVLVTGACGQLGMDAVRALSARGHEVIPTDARPSAELPELILADLTKEDEARALVASCRPDAVLHCAAWTAVDEAEKPELIREAVFAEIDRLIAEGINEKDFQRVKKSAYGVMVRELNNVEAVASLMLNAYMENVSPYDSISIMSELTCGDVIDFMRSQLRRDRCVLSVIETED